MRNQTRSLFIVGGTVLIAIVAYLAIGVFGVHTLFINDEVAEANPFDTVSEPTSAATSEVAATDPADADPAPAAEVAEETAAPEEVAEVITVTTGAFVDGDHPTSGTGFTITDGSQTFLRFEDFETDNGPDLNVYLRSSDDQNDYLDLGDLEGNIGDQNYELPVDIDLDRYDLVDIWCVRFGVSFGSALLSAP